MRFRRMAIFKYVDHGGNASIVSQNLPTYLIHSCHWLFDIGVRLQWKKTITQWCAHPFL